MIDYQSLWFVLWGLLWAFYFMTDGFDLGVGILYPFLARDDLEKRMMIHSIGPVWDGNEVWLVTAGGATFAAFPAAYGMMFSYLYTPFLLILLALIFRGVAFEFRAKGESAAWRRGWDLAIFFGSLLPALLFGVAFGNIFQGLAMDDRGFHGGLVSLLNPYGVMTGLLFVAMFVCHGALWLAFKTGNELGERAARFALRTWLVLILAAVLFMVNTAFATPLFDNYLKNKVLFLIPTAAILSLLGVGMFTLKKRYLQAFIASGIAIGSIVAIGLVGLYPQLLPSRIDPRFSLTIYNASSSPYTLRIMTVVALIFVPLVIGYQAWVYALFRGPVTKEDVLADRDAY
ncbi:MAG: cytochrome d ubiquinol oxidase subunit II [Syntrophobacterales bacterium]|nr:cytochrome d ubiquinol oxidase subunit II [Syntrophobacterales bacterium]